MNTIDAAREIVHALEEKKGENIILLDIQGISTFTDYFIICSGTSDRMLHGLADEVSQKAKQILDWRGITEGQPADGWIVVDLHDIVVHLFSPDQREYYQLEELWESGKTLLHLQ